MGDRLISLGFSNVGDYAREILDIKDRTAEAAVHLSRGLRTRPLLREAVRSGLVRRRSAETVLRWHAARRRRSGWSAPATRRSARSSRRSGPSGRACRRTRSGRRSGSGCPKRTAPPWDLAAKRRRWDELRGFCAYLVKRSGLWQASVPVRIALTLEAEFRAVREVEGCLLPTAPCLVRVARHFIETWKPHAKKARTLSQEVRERDLGRCTVPGCSRRAVHSHHVLYSSRGGPDDPANLTGLCGCHHLRGVHGGHIRVWGIAPDQLTWEVGGAMWKDGDSGPSAVEATSPAAR